MKTKILCAAFVTAAIAVTALAQIKSVAVAAGDEPGAVLTVPADSKVDASKTETDIRTTNMFLIVRPLANIAKPEDALPRTAEIIKSDFVKFVATATNDITIAGAPAKQLTGTGAEADDGDPGTADVIFFSAGRHVFAACVHGEHDAAAQQRKPMLDILQTAKSP
jgi:hypothetical protein